MDKTEQLREEISKKDDLVEQLIELWKNNASADEIGKVIQAAGFEVTDEEVEKLFELMQREQAASIAKKELCEDDLQKVNGSGNGMSCESTWDCESTFRDTNLDPRAKCEWFHVCDEFYGIVSYKK